MKTAFSELQKWEQECLKKLKNHKSVFINDNLNERNVKKIKNVVKI